MKNIIITLNWINRVLVTSSYVTLLIGLVDNEVLFYTLMLAFILGCFQVLSSIITLFKVKKYSIKIRKQILNYIIGVICYFLCAVVIFQFSSYLNNPSVLGYMLLWLPPFVLSIYWTNIIESLKIEI